MVTLLVQCCISVLVWWALGPMYSAAERQYFIPGRNLSWDEARSHCQICYKELVTLTPENSHRITNMLNSEHWIGLRKYFNSTDNSSMSWSHWANGDPLFFQNWFPGWPVFKSPAPKIDCCSCSCTCPANTPTEMPTPSPFPENLTDLTTLYDFADLNMTNATSFWESITGETTSYTSPSYTTTGLPLKIESTCERTPLVPENNETETANETDTYIEDSCVVMLPSGPWVEKNCWELLPFVCYEDRFFGQVNVTDVTSNNATLTWLNATGVISHYRVEITSFNGMNVSTLTHEVDNLIPGKHYEVQVFPVKCGRDLNPQKASFYTVPNKVEDLNVTNVSETSATLSWNKPDGELDFYLIKYEDKTKRLDVNQTVVVDGLIPGRLYTFTVLTGVLDESKWSEESNVKTNTKPGKVSNLTVSGNTNQSVQLNWTAPEGSFTGFRVTAVGTDSAEKFLETEVNQKKHDLKVEGLPSGSEIHFSVTTLANYTTTLDYTPLTQEGDTVTVISYTTPGPISNLSLYTNESALNATWNGPKGYFSSFRVLLKLDGKEKTVINTKEENVTFSDLNNSANYTVVVYAVIKGFQSPPVESSVYTKPSRPTDVKATFRNVNSITFEWKAPKKAENPTYLVTLNSTLWNYKTTRNTSETNYTFCNLTSGTKYDLSVYALAGGHVSEPAPGYDYTVPKKVEISLSMMCSSANFLLCDKETTRDKVHQKLKEYFAKTLGDHVLWELPKK